MFAIWNEFARLVSDALPAFTVGLLLSAGVQWLALRSHSAARAVSWVAQSVPGAALAGAALPGCSMTTVPLAIPLKRQGAGDGPLLAFIITSALLGPASIILTFTMFGPVWGALRVALPLIAVCGLGWGLQRFGKKLPSDVRTSTAKPLAPRRVGATGKIAAILQEKSVLLGQPAKHDPQSRSDSLVGLAYRGCGVCPDRQGANRTMDGRWGMGLRGRGGGGHTGLCLRGGRSSPHGGTGYHGRGNRSRLYLHASLRRHLLANSNDAA